MTRGDVAFALAVVFASPAAAGPRDVERAEAEALRSKASQAWDVRVRAGKPVMLRADVEIPGKGSEPLRGRWSLELAGPGQWREELELPGFREVLVANDDGWWLSREPPRYLQLVADLQDALDPATRLVLLDTHAVISGKRGSDATSPIALRVEGKAAMLRPPWRPFIDPSGRLVRLESLFSYTTYEYEGRVQVGESEFPQVVRVLHDGKVAATATVSVVPPPPPDPARMAPPEGVIASLPSWTGRCETVRLNEKRVGEFTFPTETVIGSGAGVSRSFFVVNLDGSVREVIVRWASHAGYVQPTLDLLSACRYKPPRCDGKTMPVLVEHLQGFGAAR